MGQGTAVRAAAGWLVSVQLFGVADQPRTERRGRQRLSAAAARTAPRALTACNPPQPQRVITSAYTTGYTWFDNTPPGSGEISHPVLHAKAGGSGTYANPITAAVGHSMATGRDVLDYPAGTRFYLPHVRRYFIVEDTCGEGRAPQNVACHNRASAPAPQLGSTSTSGAAPAITRLPLRPVPGR